MMRKTLSTILLLFISILCFSQDGYESWDKRYVKANISDVIRFETVYADSVNKGLIDGKYYSRFSLYQIKGEYLGEKRDMADSIKTSMENVNKLFGEKDFLPVITAIKKEYRFRIDGNEYWFPIQNVLEEPFQNEIIKSDTVTLYCIFFNEHRWNGALYNTFLISEFRKE
jgi:hypothetical protein